MNGFGNSVLKFKDKGTSLNPVLEWMRDELERVDKEIRKNLKSNVPIISTIVEHLLQSGGKRLRPLLLILSAKLCGYEGNEHIPMASLIEFIHTATLLHDDVVDHAELRRGMESANSKWGNEACVLVGDFLFTRSFSLMVENGDPKILKTISNATTLMAEGELEELIKTNDLSLTEEEYLSIITRKTAVLFSAATRIGAILGKVSEEKEKALSDFGMDFGIAFQLTDDALDYTSREEEFGKRIGIDLQDGKVTLPLIHTLRSCTHEEKTFIQRAIESDPVERASFLQVVRIIEKYNGLDYTYQKARSYIEKAKENLYPFSPSGEKEALFLLSDYVLERKL